MCVSVLLCIEALVHLVSTSPSGSHSRLLLPLLQGSLICEAPIGFDGGDLFRTDIPKYFLSSYEYLFVVFLSVAEEGFSDDSKALI